MDCGQELPAHVEIDKWRQTPLPNLLKSGGKTLAFTEDGVAPAFLTYLRCSRQDCQTKHYATYALRQNGSKLVYADFFREPFFVSSKESVFAVPFLRRQQQQTLRHAATFQGVAGGYAEEFVHG